MACGVEPSACFLLLHELLPEGPDVEARQLGQAISIWTRVRAQVASRWVQPGEKGYRESASWQLSFHSAQATRTRFATKTMSRAGRQGARPPRSQVSRRIF
eukprot:scaffold21265_cov131-Isochrysis_galbana.AAC.5